MELMYTLIQLMPSLMIDFVKFQPENSIIEEILNNPILEFTSTINRKTGEVNESEIIAEYYGLKFIIINKKYLLIQGSIHKYKNKGVHNFDQFTFRQLIDVLNDIKEKFKIDLSTSRLLNIEVGINFYSEIDPKEILTYLIYHKGLKFKDISVKNGNYKKIMHQRYYVKFYDKGLQNNLPYFLLRFELKFVKMNDLNKIGISYLSDLLSFDKIHRLKYVLDKEWNEVFLFDFTIDKTLLKRHTKEVKMHQWNNPIYWLGITRYTRVKQKKMYQNIVDNFSFGMHKRIKNIINVIFDELLFEKGNILTLHI